MGWKGVCLGTARLARPLAAALIPPHVKQFHDNSLAFPTQANDKHAGIWEKNRRAGCPSTAIALIDSSAPCLARPNWPFQLMPTIWFSDRQEGRPSVLCLVSTGRLLSHHTLREAGLSSEEWDLVWFYNGGVRQGNKFPN
ncbi:hypothetical protein Q8A67_000595 [Cirrhinus molitorella]|uniref:Uncharacterized protein n=1 Tax=Cirrhinus molitorella TaxID=172907 RepID=A0AA88QA05_9TELE|nr:hypothetical protein Q8A67_000595 [Cirrhinus molitorella]